MVSLDISVYLGFDILQKFEHVWAEIQKEGLHNALAVKNLQNLLRRVKNKHVILNDTCSKFFKHTETIDTIQLTLDKLAEDLQKLLVEFNNLEEILNLLESVCDEEQEVERILKAHEENHALRIRRQQEVEELKASLAKEHAAYLENFRMERAERKLSTEKAIHNAFWKASDDDKVEDEETRLSQNIRRFPQG